MIDCLLLQLKELQDTEKNFIKVINMIINVFKTTMAGHPKVISKASSPATPEPVEDGGTHGRQRPEETPKLHVITQKKE